MNKKFCRIIENNSGAQLLLLIRRNPDSDGEPGKEFEVSHITEDEDMFVSFSIGPISLDDAKTYIETYKEEQAFNFLADPQAAILSMVG